MCLFALCGQAGRPSPIHLTYLMGTKLEGTEGLGGGEEKEGAVGGAGGQREERKAARRELKGES